LYTEVNFAYLRGAMGFIVVADGTRLETLDVALELRQTALADLGPDIPHCLLINKADIMEQWEITPERMQVLQEQGITLFCTSAKTGQAVEEAFAVLARKTLQERLHE
jgi:signal recognition particle receptor subunit beta